MSISSSHTPSVKSLQDKGFKDIFLTFSVRLSGHLSLVLLRDDNQDVGFFH